MDGPFGMSCEGSNQMNKHQILFQKGDYWIIRAAKAYEVYQFTGTVGCRCAIIGLSLGLDRAIAEIERRLAK